ncbi:MAG: hypothetical protein H6Q48_1777, partial [Deltaproteobacteria bacterium]|nr:hypothetical protein [Deltaproteobacteria bacterium]
MRERTTTSPPPYAFHHVLDHAHPLWHCSVTKNLDPAIVLLDNSQVLSRFLLARGRTAFDPDADLSIDVTVPRPALQEQIQDPVIAISAMASFGEL